MGFVDRLKDAFSSSSGAGQPSYYNKGLPEEQVRVMGLLRRFPGYTDEQLNRDAFYDRMDIASVHQWRVKAEAALKEYPDSAAAPAASAPPIVEGSLASSELTSGTLDAMEAEAVRMVSKANTSAALHSRLHQLVIFVFKTFAPFAVLALTIPESIWVFSHIYTHSDQTLTVLTGVFAVLTDFGYLYLTVLLAMNKEALEQRRRAGIEIEAHERRAVRLQAILWWVVAPLDTGAQVIFLYSATKDSTFFAYGVVMALVAVRVFSLFITMFIVSFAGTELMTSVDRAANQEVERANGVARVTAALGTARLARQRARQALQKELDAQELERQGQLLLSEVYADARTSVRQKMLAPPAGGAPGSRGGAAKLGG